MRSLACLQEGEGAGAAGAWRSAAAGRRPLGAASLPLPPPPSPPCSNKIMDPEVPQALRLQAILVGGIVIVHAKQQGFLLEDAQEMLVRPAAAGCWPGAAVCWPGAAGCWHRWPARPPPPTCRPAPQRRLRELGSGGEGGAAAKFTLGGDAAAAREEAITLPAFGDAALLGLGDLFPTFAQPAMSEGPATSGRTQARGRWAVLGGGAGC